MATTHPHVAIYTRISKDRYGNAETCSDQEQLGRAYAEKVWPGLPVKVYSDPDLSAFRDDVYRPGYETLREAIKAGHVLHLWSWSRPGWSGGRCWRSPAWSSICESRR